MVSWCLWVYDHLMSSNGVNLIINHWIFGHFRRKLQLWLKPTHCRRAMSSSWRLMRITSRSACFWWREAYNFFGCVRCWVRSRQAAFVSQSMLEHFQSLLNMFSNSRKNHLQKGNATLEIDHLIGTLGTDFSLQDYLWNQNQVTEETYTSILRTIIQGATKSLMKKHPSSTSSAPMLVQDDFNLTGLSAQARLLRLNFLFLFVGISENCLYSYATNRSFQLGKYENKMTLLPICLATHCDQTLADIRHVLEWGPHLELFGNQKSMSLLFRHNLKYHDNMW